LRFRLRWLADEPRTATRLADRLAALDGVAEARVRPLTGSVLVHYDSRRTDGARVTSALLDATGLDHITVEGQETPAELETLERVAASRGGELARALVASMKALDRDLLCGSAGGMSLGTVAALVLSAMAAGRVIRTGTLELPEWYQLAWWAYRTFTTSEADLIRATPAHHEAHHHH
jgi:hypothetical protein